MVNVSEFASTSVPTRQDVRHRCNSRRDWKSREIHSHRCDGLRTQLAVYQRSGVSSTNWRHSVVVSTLASTLGPVSTRMGDRLQAGKPSRYVASHLGQHLGQLSLPSIRGR